MKLKFDAKLDPGFMPMSVVYRDFVAAAVGSVAPPVRAVCVKLDCMVLGSEPFPVFYYIVPCRLRDLCISQVCCKLPQIG